MQMFHILEIVTRAKRNLLEWYCVVEIEMIKTKNVSFHWSYQPHKNVALGIVQCRDLIRIRYGCMILCYDAIRCWSENKNCITFYAWKIRNGFSAFFLSNLYFYLKFQFIGINFEKNQVEWFSYRIKIVSLYRSQQISIKYSVFFVISN